MQPVYLKAMAGLGDNLYIRPFIRDMVKRNIPIALQTAYPDLFSDMSLRIVRPQTGHPNAMKSIRQWGDRHHWRGAPDASPGLKMMPSIIGYDPESWRPITEQIEAQFPLRSDYLFNLPDVKSDMEPLPPKLAIIRPLVKREGFDFPSRDPLNEYILKAEKALRLAGFVTIGVASIGYGEVAAAEMPKFDVDFTKGQLPLFELINLFRKSSAVVAGPGFAQLMGVAANGPQVMSLWGNRGKFDNPNRIFDRRMAVKNLWEFRPAWPCHHSTEDCGCDKTIPLFDEWLDNFVFKVTTNAQAR